MNPNNNKIFTPQEALKILNEAYEMIVNQNKYKLDLNTIKSLYEGFYAGFKLLIKLPDLPPDIKYQLIAKKSMVDYYYSSNITYSEYNMLKIHKSVANQTLKNNEYLNKKANILTNIQALELKAKVTELNNNEKNKLRNHNLAKLAANIGNLTLKKNK